MSAFPESGRQLPEAAAPFGEMAETAADPESSKRGNGDLQHLREMTLRSA
jgi:hypothetical protein